MLARIKPYLPKKFKFFLKKIRKKIRIFGALDRGYLSYHYLKGNGIEIGALHNSLDVWSKAKVKYVDRYDNEGLKQHYPEQDDPFVKVDIVDNGELLSTIPNESQDFVIANHFIEHCQNPLLTLKHMHRVLKNEGILYIALPDKRFTFDVKRPVTPLEHLLKDFHEGPDASKRQHFEEWVSLVHNVKDTNQAKQDVEHLIAQDYSIHFHVWTQSEMLEMILALKKHLDISFDVEVCLKLGVEFILVLRKMA
jgi:predicted SAM-dependent methyltransferase